MHFSCISRGLLSKKLWIFSLRQVGKPAGLAIPATGQQEIVNWCVLGGKVPGEIDVLALHPSGLYALVVECKVLTQPFSRSKLTNVVGKLGPDDQAGFHSNLERKVNWLAKESVLQGTDVVGALLVDQGSFLGEGAVNPVMDLEGLHALLTYLNKNIDSDTATSARS